MRCGRTPGVRARACGSARGQQSPPRSPGARPCASAVGPRSPASSGRRPPRPGRASCTPMPSASPGDRVRRCTEMLIAPRRRGLGRVARHRARARRHDDRRIGMPCSDPSIDVVPVERAVGGEGGDGTLDLVEQGTDLRAIVDVVAGQLRRNDPAGVGVRAEMQLLPGPARPGPCFSASHSPWPQSFSPVLSTSRCTGPEPERTEDAAPPGSRPGG